MLVYQTFGQFKKVPYQVYTIAEHLETYRDEYPTRRRQLNAVTKDLQNMDDALEAISSQLAPATAHFAHYLGDKYTSLDLYDMQKDRANIQAAHDFIKDAPCPAKVAKELDAIASQTEPDTTQSDALAELYQDAQEDAAAVGMQEINEPQTLQIELPAGFTKMHVYKLWNAVTEELHKLTMKDIENDCKNYRELETLTRAAWNIKEQLNHEAWKEDDALENYARCAILR